METRRDVRLAGKSLKSAVHACAFFRSREEEYRVLFPFLADGAETGDKCIQIVDKHHRQERLAQMRQQGIDVDTHLTSGQFEIHDWEDAHIRNGKFDQFAMLNFVEATLQEGKEKNIPFIRFWGNMEWALTDLPGVRDLIEYEARLNQMLPNYDNVVICTYDLGKFSAQTVIDIMRTHPMVVVGGTLQENPFFVPPEVFLKEIAERDEV